MATPYGKAVRKLRIDLGIKLKDMADALKVNSAYLSALETGRKRITNKALEQAIAFFEAQKSLEATDIRSQLQPLVELSQPECVIALKDKEEEDRELVVAFARRFSDLTTDDKDQLKSMLDMK